MVPVKASNIKIRKPGFHYYFLGTTQNERKTHLSFKVIKSVWQYTSNDTSPSQIRIITLRNFQCFSVSFDKC